MRLLRLVLPFVIFCLGGAAQAQVLPSWNGGIAREQIVDFVQAVTTAGGQEFVPQEQRIAVFDNDGTGMGCHENLVELRMRRPGQCRTLDEATAKGWTVVDMKQDWRVVYSQGNPSK